MLLNCKRKIILLVRQHEANIDWAQLGESNGDLHRLSEALHYLLESEAIESEIHISQELIAVVCAGAELCVLLT